MKPFRVEWLCKQIGIGRVREQCYASVDHLLANLTAASWIGEEVSAFVGSSRIERKHAHDIARGLRLQNDGIRTRLNCTRIT